MLKSMNFLRGKSWGRVGGGGGLSSLAPVILGFIPRILLQRVSNLVNKFALLLNKCWLREDSWDKPKNDGCWGRGVGTFSQSGRSMIEMLGVLAIIAVLSVGGIAGYSKAMEKFKVNKLISEYNMLIFGLMEHKQSILLPDDDNIDFELGETIKALNLVPENWRLLNEKYLDDGRGNLVNARIGQSSVAPVLVIDFNLGGLSEDESGSLISTTFSNKLCFEMFNTLVYPLRDGLVMGRVFITGNKEDNRYYGAAYCGGGNKCLQDLNFSDIKRECDACDGKNRCNVTITF